MLVSTVGFAWITASEYLILPDDPVSSLKRSVDVFCRSAGAAVAGVVGMLTTTCDGSAPDRAARALRRSLGRVMRCRTAIESQLSGALLPDFGQHGVEQLRVALYCAERGTEDLINQANDPLWIDTLPDDIAGSITSTLQTLANDLRDNNIDADRLDAVARELQCLRDRLHDATNTAPNVDDAPHPPSGTALAALTTVGGAKLVAQSTSQATALAIALPVPPSTAGPASAAAAEQTTPDTPPAGRTLAPTMALAIQAAVASGVAS